jgi:hypothetical protein
MSHTLPPQMVEVPFRDVKDGEKVRHADESNIICGHKIASQLKNIPGVGFKLLNIVCGRGYACLEDTTRVFVERNPTPA